jgi:hypothetical protein
LIYDEFSFSPLKKNDLQKLFKGYDGSFHKVCSKDFLGISSKGELFDIFFYKLESAEIRTDFPQLSKWGNKEITNETLVGKWKNCPLDSLAMKLYEFTLTSNNLNEVKCSESLIAEIANPKNYYSYIHFNELEQYLLIYNTNKHELYYIRRKGF